MKKIVLTLSLLMMLTTQALAGFLYTIPILSREEIQKLSDDELIEIYIEARIEEKASEEFHRAAGFNSAKEYNARKKLLRFVFELRREMARRGQGDSSSVDELLK